jgi:hypothetical protein
MCTWLSQVSCFISSHIFILNGVAMISDTMKNAIADILQIPDNEKRLSVLKQYLSGFKSYFDDRGTDYTYVATQIYLNGLK